MVKVSSPEELIKIGLKKGYTLAQMEEALFKFKVSVDFTGEEIFEIWRSLSQLAFAGSCSSFLILPL